MGGMSWVLERNGMNSKERWMTVLAEMGEGKEK